MQTKIAATDPTVTGGVWFSWEYVQHWPHENVATPAAYQWYYDEINRIYKPLI